jgi:hypothetical protein
MEDLLNQMQSMQQSFGEVADFVRSLPGIVSAVVAWSTRVAGALALAWLAAHLQRAAMILGGMWRPK